MSSKLKSVIRHEYLTIVKQPGFILSMIGLPLLIAAIVAIGYFSDRTAQSGLEEASAGIDSLAVVDDSGQINPEIVDGLGYQLLDVTADELKERVRLQQLSAAVYYPPDALDSRQAEVFVDVTDNAIMAEGAVNQLAQQLLRASLVAGLDDENIALILQDGAQISVTTFADGEETLGFGEYIVPGAFMVIFFIILFFTIGYMLLGVSEEKENRSIEMVLTYLKPRTLITGKLLSIGLVGLTQLVFFGLLGGIGFLIYRQTDLINLPFNLDVSNVVFDPVVIIASILILVFGFLMFAAIMSGVAAMMPGVKEANSLSGVFYILAFVPFWALSVVVTAPDSPIVRFLSFFPLTSPTTLHLRNTLGSISGAELWLAILVLAIFTIGSFWLAARLFRLGALEFNDRIKLSSLMK